MVGQELESFRSRLEPGSGIVRENGLQVFDYLELEHAQVSIIRSELLVEIRPGDELRARYAGGADGAPGEPGIEIDLERRAQLLDDVHVDRNRPSGELIEEVGVKEEPGRFILGVVPPELMLVAEVVTGVALASPIGHIRSLCGVPMAGQRDAEETVDLLPEPGEGATGSGGRSDAEALSESGEGWSQLEVGGLSLDGLGGHPGEG